MNTEQPLAIALAERLDVPPGAPLLVDAAAELRRLHAENEALREALTRMRHWAEADNVNYTGDHPVAQARAALARAGEMK